MSRIPDSYNGIIRKVTDGYVKIPTAWLGQFGILDQVEIVITDKGLLLRKPNNYCIFCGSNINLKDVYGKKVCQICMINLQKLKEE